LYNILKEKDHIADDHRLCKKFFVCIDLRTAYSNNQPEHVEANCIQNGKKCNKVIFLVFFVYVCLFVIDVTVVFLFNVYVPPSSTRV